MTRREPHNAVTLGHRDVEVLRDFARAYLHEDFAQEYGGAPGAAKAFSADASVDERARVADALDRLAAAADGKPVAALVEFLVAHVRGAWVPASVEDVRALSHTVRPLKSEG